jgi:hypothetical protein
MARTDFVPDLLNKLMKFKEQGTGIATGYGVADRLRLIDYKGAEPQSTWKSASYVRGGEGFGNRNFFS